MLKEKREAILEIAAHHGAHNVRVFGSVARGEANEQSDIDFLVAAPSHSQRSQTAMTKDPRVYMAHILECIERIERFTHSGREGFFREVLIQDAVIRSLEIIGEAAKRVDDNY